MKLTWLLCVGIVVATFLTFACQKEQTIQKHANFEPFFEEPTNVLSRGLVALPAERGVFLSWRRLPKDSSGMVYEIYRHTLGVDNGAAQMIKQTPLTNFIDDSVKAGSRYAYEVRATYEKQTNHSAEVEVVAPTKLSEQASLHPNTGTLVFDVGTYIDAQLVTGDLNGDGEREVVIKHTNNWDVDPSPKAWQKSKDTYKVTAFLANGKPLWTINLGWGIEAGVFYSPMVVWDIDGDGRAEVLIKTNKSGDPKDYSSDRLAVLDGETGAVKQEVPWPHADGLGDDYNSNSRNYIAVAHLDGKNPYIVVARGLYENQRLYCYDNKLQKVWERVIADGTHSSHSLTIADVNDDGKEEIMWGEHCISEGGKDLWTIKERMPYSGHPDIVYVADVLPSNPGKEVYYCREGWYGQRNRRIGMFLANNQGEIIWAHWYYRHVDGGWVSKIIPNTEGMQCYAYDIGGKKISEHGVKIDTIYQYIFTPEGKIIARPSMHGSFPVDWDGDGVREICMRNGKVSRFNGPVIAKLDSNTIFGADLFGDHREEIISAPATDGKVYIYFNTAPLEAKPRVSPLADRQYRNDVSRTAMQHNLIPYESGILSPQATPLSAVDTLEIPKLNYKKIGIPND
jgi:hypothetical protein